MLEVVMPAGFATEEVARRGRAHSAALNHVRCDAMPIRGGFPWPRARGCRRCDAAPLRKRR
jgi:hypothetical protein